MKLHELAFGLCSRVLQQSNSKFLLSPKERTPPAQPNHICDALLPTKDKRRKLLQRKFHWRRLVQAFYRHIKSALVLKQTVWNPKMAQRLAKEYRDMQKEAKRTADPEIFLSPVKNCMLRWRGSIRGPEGTPYEGGRFNLDVNIPSSYPLAAPNIRFATKIFHPNVHPKTGEICLDILKNAWSPAWTLQSTCRAIIVLLAHPEPDSPLNCDAGNLLRNGDNRGYLSVAKMYTNLYAVSKGGPSQS